MIHIADGWYTITDLDSCLLFCDLRFGQLSVEPNSPSFVWQYLLYPQSNGTVDVVRKEPDVGGGKIGGIFSDLMERIKGM